VFDIVIVNKMWISCYVLNNQRSECMSFVNDCLLAIKTVKVETFLKSDV